MAKMARQSYELEEKAESLQEIDYLKARK